MNTKETGTEFPSAGEPAARIRIELAYDGADFAGWQAQPGRDTIQARVESAAARLYRLPPSARIAVTGAGRTDAGVHAEGQVAHFDAPLEIPPAGIRAGLNGLLPKAIRVLAAEEAAPGFHARFDATGKTYHYWLVPARVASPLLARFAWPAGTGLSRAAMEEAAAAFEGRHDFRAFFAAPPGEAPRSPIRTIATARFRTVGEAWIFEVRADGFLRYMVRRMVGTLAAVGRGAIPPGQVRAMLRDPSAPGPRFRAPAAGLRLHRVHYRPDDAGPVPRRSRGEARGRAASPSGADGGHAAKLAGP